MSSRRSKQLRGSEGGSGRQQRGSGWAAAGRAAAGRAAAGQCSRWAAAGRRRGRDDGLAPSFFTRYPPHDCLEGSGVVSGAYAANVSGFRMRGADHAGPREKLSATRSLSAPSERQRLSADGPLARRPGVSHAGYFALVLVSWRPGVFATAYQCSCIGGWLVAPCTRAVQPLTKASGLDGRLRRTPRHQDNERSGGWSLLVLGLACGGRVTYLPTQKREKRASRIPAQ